MDNTNNTRDTSDNNDTHVTCRLVSDASRMDTVDRLFGLRYVLQLEPTVFQFAEHLADNYDYGYWQFYTLSNGGFYLAPRSDTIYNVSSANGFEGQMTADALGIVACLYAYSHLSFGDGTDSNEATETYANHYHWLREYAMDHKEVRSILRAID